MANDLTSLRFSQHYGLQLSPQIIELLDQPRLIELFDGEFNQCADIEDLLQEAPTTIWPGFMLPDTLPLISNRYGDWLCLRIGKDSHISEILHWYHGGGDWIPYGATLAEALLYSSCESRLPNNHQRSARLEGKADPAPGIDWIARALDSGQGTINHILKKFELGDQSNGLAALEQQNWCCDVVNRDQIELAIANPLWTCEPVDLAKKCGGLDPSLIVLWMFDTGTIPSQHRQTLDQLFHRSYDEWAKQNWKTAQKSALRALSRRRDLAWSSDIAGWALLRIGKIDQAIQMFSIGIDANAFSDQSVRLHSHWFDPGFGKFSVAQLMELADKLPQELNSNSNSNLKMLLDTKKINVHERVAHYWLDQATAHELRGEFDAAYDAYYRAGWDVGCQDTSLISKIFGGLQRTAQQSGALARARVAGAHLASFLSGKRA